MFSAAPAWCSAASNVLSFQPKMRNLPQTLLDVGRCCWTWPFNLPGPAVEPGLAVSADLALSFLSLKSSLYFTLQWNSGPKRPDSRVWTPWDTRLLGGCLLHSLKGPPIHIGHLTLLTRDCPPYTKSLMSLTTVVKK